jgi:uncharacterized protein YcbK (DUF882 family)
MRYPRKLIGYFDPNIQPNISMSATLLSSQEKSAFTRRSFLATMAVAGLGMVKLPRVLRAIEAPRSLSLHHIHTGERLTAEYFAGGEYLPNALHEVNHVLRDWRQNEIHPIDPALLDLLHQLHAATGSREPFEVFCGYRTPATHAMLHSHSEKVAVNSLHLQGKAIDIRLSDVPLSKLRDDALKLRLGGVGYYPASDFVHVDTGRVRAW